MRLDDQKLAPISGANKGTGFQINRPPAKKNLAVVMGTRGQDKGSAAGKQLESAGMSVRIMVIERNFTSEAQHLVRSAGAGLLIMQ